MADELIADTLIVAGEIEFGDRRAVAAVGPQRLFGVGEGDAHDRGFGERWNAFGNDHDRFGKG
jgi:hypothetical protein